jgi:sRNA-binding protein
MWVVDNDFPNVNQLLQRMPFFKDDFFRPFHCFDKIQLCQSNWKGGDCGEREREREEREREEREEREKRERKEREEKREEKREERERREREERARERARR